jgi:ribonuclease P protein component
MTFGWDRSQHLKSKIAIAEVFTQGTSFSGFPLRILIIEKNVKDPKQKTQALVSVPKKKCKLAVQRNVVKRRIWEALRLHQVRLNELTQQQQITLNLAIVYTGSPEVSYAQIEKGLKKALQKIYVHLEKKAHEKLEE